VAFVAVPVQRFGCGRSFRAFLASIMEAMAVELPHRSCVDE